MEASPKPSSRGEILLDGIEEIVELESSLQDSFQSPPEMGDIRVCRYNSLIGKEELYSIQDLIDMYEAMKARNDVQIDENVKDAKDDAEMEFKDRLEKLVGEVRFRINSEHRNAQLEQFPEIVREISAIFQSNVETYAREDRTRRANALLDNMKGQISSGACAILEDKLRMLLND